MRLFLLSTSMGMGGADQQILILAKAMRARGHEVRIMALAPLGPMGEEAQRAGIPTESLELRRTPAHAGRILRLCASIRRWQPDVLHSHMVHANLLASAVRSFTGVPALVATIHSINDGGRVWMAAYRASSAMVDRFTIISRLAAERYISIGAVPRRLVQVVPNAVDVEWFRRQPEAGAAIRRELGLGDAFVWLAVGRFEEAKDYPSMIAGFARLSESRSDSHLLLVGKGSLRENVEQLVRAHHLEGQVHFLGVRRDVPQIMSAADGYVLSSAWEGMPVVLLEAAAVELPIVSTRVGGVAEVVEDGGSGLLVPPGNPEALADAMKRIEQMPEQERRAMGAHGRRLVERQYATNHIMDVWERLYSELARSGGGNGGQR
jgi:glycosyltransferase involved in cell wall biosynthesis